MKEGESLRHVANRFSLAFVFKVVEKGRSFPFEEAEYSERRITGYWLRPVFLRGFFPASGFVVFLHRESYLYLFRRTLSRLGGSRYFPAAVAYHPLSATVGCSVAAQFATALSLAFESQTSGPLYPRLSRT